MAKTRIPGLAIVLVLSTTACTKPAPFARDQILLPLRSHAAIQPSDADLASRELIRAAFLNQPEKIEASLATLERLAHDPSQRDQEVENRIPLSIDLANATLDDPLEYRAACKRLLKHSDLDPRLESRLEECVADDPLKLAKKRIWDARQTLWADTYNAIAEPLGRSVFSGLVLAPYYIATSVAKWLAKFATRDPFPVQLRQALVLRERFLARFPDATEAPETQKKVEATREKLHREQARRLAHNAKQSYRAGRIRYAQKLAQRAARRDPENRRAQFIAAKAALDLDTENDLRKRSERGPAPFRLLDSERERAFSTTLLDPDADIADEARQIFRDAGSRRQAEVASFAIAMMQHEAGREDASWSRLGNLARLDPSESHMARHAEALIQNPTRNPYGTYRATARRQTALKLRWRLLGPFASGAGYSSMPAPIALLLRAPSMFSTLMSAPARLLMSPVTQAPNFEQPVALAARRYLEINPSGKHKEEIARWLFDYEEEARNWNAALRFADFIPDIDPEERAELVEKAAEEQLEVAARIERHDRKNSMLRHTAQEFPESVAGHSAGVQVREEILASSSQKIRITRGFLKENPQVAGPGALGIRPQLIDGKNQNGELHPRGVTFLGGRNMEFEFINESGDEDDPSESVRHQISKTRLARVVSMIEVATYRNSRIDPDDEVAPDARRDQFFERARLGLTDKQDPRATAQSTYVFEGMRERYGLVRGRDSILPFDLVIRGGLSDLGLSAFPRWRKPRETPDAFLYR